MNHQVIILPGSAHWSVAPAMDAFGTAVSLGQKYRDGVERMEISIDPGRTGALPVIEGRRVPLRLRVGDATLEAGIRSTANNPNPWICPDLYDDQGRKHRLADVLARVDIRARDRILIRPENDGFVLVPSPGDRDAMRRGTPGPKKRTRSHVPATPRDRGGTSSPNPQLLESRLLEHVERGDIDANTEAWTWNSGVYCLVDCVFSAQAKYESMILPMLRERLSQRPGLQDSAELRFSAFLGDVDSFGPDKIERYSAEVLNRQVIVGRRKTEICYEAAQLFIGRGFETKADLQAIPPEVLETLVRRDLVRIRGIGDTLARYLLLLLGLEDHIKPDVMILRFFASLSSWIPRTGSEEDVELIRSVIRSAARRLGMTPAGLDHAIWRYESAR